MVLLIILMPVLPPPNFCSIGAARLEQVIDHQQLVGKLPENAGAAVTGNDISGNHCIVAGLIEPQAMGFIVCDLAVGHVHVVAMRKFIATSGTAGKLVKRIVVGRLQAVDLGVKVITSQ
jgi:hypothetical protein